MPFDSNSFERSHQLAQQHIEDAVSPHDLARVLTRSGARYVLIGGHAIGYFTGTPRATVDVDVIVSSAQVSKAIKAIQAKYPELTMEDLRYNIRFNSARSEGRVGKERIDVVRDNVPLFNRILQRYTINVPVRGQSIQLPTAEAAVALKFAAIVSPNRGDDRQPQDRADLSGILIQNRDLNLTVLSELGDLVYPGGGRELSEACTAIWEGKPVSM
jgi:hypothetical protein